MKTHILTPVSCNFAADGTQSLILPHFGLNCYINFLGDFGSGTATVTASIAGTTQAYTSVGSSGDVTAAAEGELIFVPACQVNITLAGSTDPDLTVVLTPVNN